MIQKKKKWQLSSLKTVSKCKQTTWQRAYWLDPSEGLRDGVRTLIPNLLHDPGQVI